jgi:hypothetical protein
VVRPADAQAASASSEAFFTNGSSYVATSDTLQLSPGRRLGFSFRTCAAGELLKQTGNSLDQLQLRLVAGSGDVASLVLTLSTGDSRIDRVVTGSFLDARWHTVTIDVGADGSRLTLGVTNAAANGAALSDEGSGMTADAGAVLRRLNLTASAPQLRIGAGLVACVREGPGVRFTKRNVAVHSVAVKWDGCLLPDTCAGKKE